MEREIYDGCSRPRLTPLATSVEVPLEAMRLVGPDTLKGELQRELTERVWASIDFSTGL